LLLIELLQALLKDDFVSFVRIQDETLKQSINTLIYFDFG
jgi:hypothetical protein